MTMQLHDKNILTQLHNDPGILSFILKLTDDDKAAFKQLLVWPRTLLGILSKTENNLIEFLNKCTVDEIALLRDVVDWPPSFISMISNSTPVLDLLNKSTVEELAHLKAMSDWPSSLIGMIANDENNIITVLKKCTPTEISHVKNMLIWPQTMFALLPKHNNKVLKFLNRINDNERLSLEQILDWPPLLLTTLRDTPQHIMVVYRMWDIVPDMTAFLKTYFSVYNHNNFDKTAMMDAFSNGQLNSKMWLIDTVESLNLSLGRVWTLCGWIGTLAYLMFIRRHSLDITHIRSFDIDDNCHELADTMNRARVVNNWDFKASTLDVNLLQYEDFTFNTVRRDGSIQPVFDAADTIINTSCDHMGLSNQWWDSIPPGKLVILQNNDFFEHDEHSNCCFSLDQFKEKYPMQQILFEGAIDCTIYNRFMLIGYK